MASVRSSQPKPASVAAPNCSSELALARLDVEMPGGQARRRSTPSRCDVRRRPAPRPARCAAARWRAPAARPRPRAACRSRATARRGRRVRLVPRQSASRMLSALSSSSAASVSVPGVTMRVTCRSTGPLAVRRVADLLADRDRLAELHQLREVLLHRVQRHAGHLDRRARRLRRAA